MLTQYEPQYARRGPKSAFSLRQSAFGGSARGKRGREAGNSAAGAIIELLLRFSDTVREEGRLNSAFAAILCLVLAHDANRQFRLRSNTFVQTSLASNATP